MITAAAIAVTVAALLFVLLVRQQDIPEPIPVSPVQHLEDRKRAIYENLRDLQFEYRVGKLSDDDYQQTKQALQKELAGVLSEMEKVSKAAGIAPARTAPIPKRTGVTCSHCGAQFPQSLKYCGECGKSIA